MLKCPKPNTCEIYHKTLLSYFSIILSGNDLKISALLKFEILGVFVNTLIADDKYPVQGCENLQFPNQMQLS